MKQKLFKCLISNTMSSVMSSVMSRVSNECRMTLDRVSTLLLLLFALSFGFNQETKAGNVNSGNVYFNTTGLSNNCYKHVTWQTKSGSDFYIDTKTLNSLGNTKLYYINVDDHSGWGNIKGFNFLGCGSSTDWGGQEITWSKFTTYASYYTARDDSWNLNGGYNVFTPSTTSKGASISGNYYGSHSDMNDKKQTLKVTIDGSDASTSPATVTLKGTHMSAWNSTSRNTNTITKNGSSSSTTYDCVVTGLVTVSYSSLADGYQFDGWYNGSTQVGTGTTYEYNNTGATTITAKFSKKTYNISYSPSSDEGQGFTYATAPLTGVYGSTVSMTINPKTGYTIAVSAVNSSTSATISLNKSNNTYTFTMPASNVAITVTPTETKTSVTISSNGNGTVSPTLASVGVATTQSVSATPADGYHFDSWAVTGNADIKGQTTENPVTLYGNGSGNTGTLKATFAEMLYTVTIVSGTPASTTAGCVTTGTAIAADAATGKKFDKWDLGTGITLVGCAVTDATITFKASQASTVTATYIDASRYNLNVVAGAGIESVSGSKTDQIVLPFSSDISATPKPGYTFAQWTATGEGSVNYTSGSASTANATVSVSVGSVTLTASATPNTNTAYTVKHYKQNLAGTGYELADTDNLTGTTDASVTPAVKSYEGFTAPSTQTVTINGDGTTEVTYNYTRNSYTLTWASLEGATTQGGTSAGSVKYGATLTAPTVTKTGYSFTGWTPTVPETMPAANSTYTAQWSEVLYDVTINTSNAEGATLKIDGDAAEWGSVVHVGLETKKDITVTPNPGYILNAFNVSNGGRVSGSGTDFTVSAAGANGTVTANPVETPTVFFKNTLGWTSVYVTLDSYWDTYNDPSKGAGSDGKTYIQMTRIGSTEYYYANITIDATSFTHIAFNEDSQPNYGNFHNTKAAYREDWSLCQPLFIPSTNTTGTHNGTTYYSDGTWDTYSTTSKYYLVGNDAVLGNWSKKDELRFVKESATSDIQTVAVTLAANHTYAIKLETCADRWYGVDANTTITTSNCTNIQFGSDKTANCSITTTIAGTYTFSFDNNSKKLSVEYPVAYQVNFTKVPSEAPATVTATVNSVAISSGSYVAEGGSVTFSASSPAGDYHFVRWIDGNGDELSTDNPYTVSNISSDVTVKAVYGGTTYAVTISSDAQGEVTPSGVQQVDNIAGLEITATATTPGYVFNQWVVTGGATVTNSNAPTTIVKATATGTVTAKYKQAQVVYFKNTLGWSNVYVYIFNQTNVMDETKGVNPSNSSRVAYGQMTLAQGETDVYVYTYDGALENMKSIAFSKDDQNAYENFDNTQASYRGDYSAANPMFVPQTTSNESKNVSDGHETKYFNNGTWFPFSRDKHYYIQFENDANQYPLVFATEGSLNATITTKNLNAYSTYRFFLYDNAHPIDAQPVSYGREEVITYDKDNTFVSFTNSSTMATVQTITGGDHVFIANFNADVRPQINIDFPAAYTFDYGVGPGGKSATAVRTSTTDTIASGDYVAPEQSVTVTQTAADGCTFVQWNTQADGMGEILSTDAQYIFDMPASAHAAYALYDGADVPSSFQILGTFNNWASSSYMRSKSIVGELVYDSIYLDAGREYQFKVHNSAGGKWYGNTGIMTQAHCTQWIFTEHTDNCTLATTIAGWYKFTLNKSSLSLNVTFPENPKQATMYDSPVKGNNTDVMIQAFYWAHNGNTSTEYTAFGDVKWAKLNNEADTLAKYFDMVWLAPSQETADYTGYLPINYSHQGSATTADGHSPWGNSTDLRNLIDHLHNGGSKVIADIVINHSSAAHADEYSGSSPNWCTWGTFDFGRYGVFNPDYTWLAKGDEMFYGKKSQAGDCGLLDNTDNETDEWDYSYMGGIASWTESEFNCAYSRDWAHKKQEVREMSRAYLSWMRDSIGYDGWRYDFVKGFHGSHIYDYNRSTGAYFSVCEVFDGDAEKQIGVLSDAGRFTYMFDFPGKFSIYNTAIREYKMQNLKGNFNTLLACNDGQYKKYAVTFIDNHDSFHEGSCLYGTANTIDDRQAHQALCYLLSMPGVPCIVYPYWNNYKEIVKKLIYARKAAGVHSESVVEEDWAGDGSYGNNHYTARIKGAHGYIFLKMGYDCRPQDAPYNQPTDPEGRTWIKAWAGEHAGVWYTTSDTQPSKYRLLITCNGQTYYSNSVTENGQDLSYYATKDAKYQWQKYEMFQWKDIAGTTPAAVAENNVYTATFDMTNIAAANVALYTGDYYIRTDEVEGGWNDYKKESHKFTYFNNASVAAGDAYRYYWVNNIAKSKEVNVHATVGNEINEHITNTLGNDEFTNGEGKVRGDSYGINIRFSYEPTTNYLGRAMILGSTSDKYLNVVGSNIYKDKNCTVALDDAYYASRPADSKLGDISNWVYEKTVFVKITNDKPASNVVIKSVFKQTPSSDEQTQYMLGFQRDFYGNVTDDPVQYAVLDYGTTKSETAYCIRVIYDFKTNRLVGAWEPVDQEITDDWNIDADVLFKRTENGGTAQITFANTGDTISSLKNVLFIMEFDRDSGATNGENFYWFSLPYDCHISSIYGVEDYVTLNEYGLPTQGTWGIQRYDGETRARTGWFKEDTQTFWKWMSKDEVLKAGEGYVLDFDKSCATFNTIGIEEACDDETDDECVDGKKTVQKAVLRLYFPSDKPGFNMTKTGSSEAVNYEDYTCNIKNRKAQDSNWRLLSPGNYSNTKIANEADITRTDNDSVLDEIPNFIYHYDISREVTDRYVPVQATSSDDYVFEYKSFYCYMAQFSGSVKWAQFTKADQTSTIAPRYYTAPGEIQRATLKLVMTNSANEQQDQTFIKLMPNATTGYDANRDLTKIINSNMAQLYSVSEEVSYAANVLPVESQQIALTVVTPKAGTYTFAMPEGTDGVTATLIDAQDGSRTDLSMWDYTVDLNKGTFAGRFFIEIDIRKTPTQIDVTNPDMLDENGNPIKTVKFLHEDQLYIQRGQHIYDATGKVVK